MRLHRGPHRRRDIPPGTQTVVEAVLDTTQVRRLQALGPDPGARPAEVRGGRPQPLLLHPGRHHPEPRPGRFRHRRPLGQAESDDDPDLCRRPAQLGHHEDPDDQPATSPPNCSRSPGRAGTATVPAHRDPEPVGRPAGFFKDEITLQTTDPNDVIPIAVVANVQSAVTVSPAVINLGRIQAGTTVQRTILVRSAQPFKVTDVKCREGRSHPRQAPRVGPALPLDDADLEGPSQPRPLQRRR